MKRTIILVGVLVAILLLAVGIFFFVRTSNQPDEFDGAVMPQEPIAQEATSTPAPVIEVTPEERAQFATSSPLLPDESLFTEDTDRDGLPDSEELALGTSTDTFDTDGDGLSDRAEVQDWNTDPTNRDTDGDGFADGFEVLNGYNPAGDGRLSEE